MSFPVQVRRYDLHRFRRPPPLDHPTIRAIQAEVSRHYGLDLNALLADDKAFHVSRPRQAAMYLCRALTPHSTTVIGRFFRNRDHSTVVHAIRAVEQRRLTDPVLDEAIKLIAGRLSA